MKEGLKKECREEGTLEQNRSLPLNSEICHNTDLKCRILMIQMQQRSFKN